MPTKQEIRDYFAKFGKKGGKARAANLTAEERIESARRAALARWAKTNRAELLEKIADGASELPNASAERGRRRK